MQHQIEISEEDIFKFVFSPENLAADKFNYLSANKERFKEEIDLCLEIKNNSGTDENNTSAEFILNKISSYKQIKLFPQISEVNEENGVKLAAASAVLSKQPNSMSFADAESKYLVRIVKTEFDCLLYLFTEDSSISSYKIHLHPSKAAYRINDVSQPIEILEEIKIEEILLEKLSK
ncbi:MAG: hypothetical protein CVV24_11575 [Ignavibacteriae bacterium HGW-Ignavibacteriae-3]|nr:MAG: hypothetical protein CVV24_11575 [Ignavibacteriae bacterium HGW-Ignavibacteriae-3]